ncbi:nucleotide-diphosphate-sugar epimerase [Planotetraspora thailandica]|uniref:Nucleotide-diphosphate-sugar epimerase n=1 Tax=Planotetraspora thailandica TaxID=487172 RepID=A0A8J3V4N5_9ACTN|nr:NmrA/HSCARG family protein [Planotetraspora thailandica]GII57328.1 nucleotide-diphosphate-sugar epimerase [Planotetraspora thailandica]
MNSKRVIAVVGATGAQGGATVRALLDDGEFAVRALTRDPQSPAARQLADLGAEVVQADLYDLPSLIRAFDDAHGTFLVTPFWNHLSAEKELEEVRNLIAAAKATKVSHVVWSTLEDTRDAIDLEDPRMPILDAKYKVPHFDVKGAEADRLFAEADLPTTYLRVSFYWDNLLTAWLPKRDEDGTPVLALPVGDSPVAGIAATDIGKSVVGIFHRPAEFVGRTIGVAGEYLTGEQIAESFSEVLGEPVVFRPMPYEDVRNLGFPGAVEIGNMFQYYGEFSEAYTGARDLEITRDLDPSVQTLTEFLADHKDELSV